MFPRPGPSINSSSTTNSIVSSHVPAVPGPVSLDTRRPLRPSPSRRTPHVDPCRTLSNQPPLPQIAAARHVQHAKTIMYTRNSRSLSARRAHARPQLCIDMSSRRAAAKLCAPQTSVSDLSLGAQKPFACDLFRLPSDCHGLSHRSSDRSVAQKPRVRIHDPLGPDRYRLPEFVNCRLP
jgi:hypothetical protein